MDEVIKQTEDIWYKAKDCCDNHADQDAQHLIEEAREIYENATNEKITRAYDR